MEQIVSAKNQSLDIWEYMSDLGRQIQGLKREADSYAAGLVQTSARESTEELAEGGADRPRRNRLQKADITKAQKHALLVNISELQQNTTAMQWKLYYLKWDYKSTFELIHDTPNRSIGVNGTDVNWEAHAADWYPTFSLLQADAGEDDALPDFGVAEQDPDSSLLQSTGRRRRTVSNIEGMPPRARYVQRIMTRQQSILDNVWDAMTVLERRFNKQTNWMHGHSLLERAEAEDESTEGAKAAKPHKTLVDEVDDSPLSEEEVLMEQIVSAKNQSLDIWEYMSDLGRQIQGLKREADSYASN